MKTTLKILAVIVAIITVFTSSIVTTQAADSRWPDDPELTYRDDFDWGAVMHAPQWGPAYSSGNLETQLHQLKEMGSTLLRIDATGDVGILDKTVMLCNTYGIKVMLIVYIPGRTFDTEVAIDPAAIEEHFYAYAKRYDGTNGCGKVDYIQLDNEMDVQIMGWTDMKGSGMEISEYPEPSLRKITEQVSYAVRGIRSGNPNVKIIINIAYVHYGILKYFQENGIEWDITGHDWYSDMFSIGNPNYDPTDRSQNFHNAGKELYDLFGKPIIICETNQWTNALNNMPIDDEGYPDDPDIKASMLDGTWWDPFVLCLEDYYNQDYVIGCTIYEFYDELAHQSGTTAGSDYLGEAHFGLMEAGTNGLFIKAKPIYERCKAMFGGGPVEMLDWDEVEASFRPEEEEKDDANSDDTGDESTALGEKYEIITNDHVTTIIPDPITVTPDPINREETTTETVYRKVPVSSGKFFTWPIIVSFVVGGVALLITAGAVTYVILKKKKAKDLK